MAGKKKGAKEDDNKGFRLPKSIAGMKLPKDTRRKLANLAGHPLVADLIAAGLVALAAKLKNEPKVKEAAADAGDAVAKASAKTQRVAKEAAQGVAETATDAAETVAKPVVKRARKATGASATAPARRAAAKPVAKSEAPKPARKTKAESAPAKPRASRSTAAKKPRAPKASKSE